MEITFSMQLQRVTSQQYAPKKSKALAAGDTYAHTIKCKKSTAKWDALHNGLQALPCALCVCGV